LKASIIIVNWNGADLLCKGLPSVMKSVSYAGNEHEIIVVDDGSTDESVKVIEQFSGIKLIALPQNRGFGAACNIGAAESQNAIVIVLNNDVIVEENFIIPLLEAFEDPGIFAVSCKIKKWDKETVEIGRTCGRFSCGFISIKRDNLGSPSITLQPTFYASGGAVAYDKGKFLQLGGFDPLYYPFYWEDNDLSYRAWKRGWEVLYQPHSVVYHQHQGTIGRSFSKSYIKTIYYRNKLLFVWKNITDVSYLFQHLICLIPYLLGTMLIGRVHNMRGFFAALKFVPVVLQRRTQEKQSGKVSDREIFHNHSQKTR